MMRQKLALVVNGAPSVALKRMNGFSPVRTSRLGSALIGSLLCSIGNQAAIDVERLAGDVACSRRCEEHHHGGDILRVVGALQRDHLGSATFHLLDADAFLLR